MPIEAAEIDRAKLKERILASTFTVTEWAAARILRGPKTELGMIDEFYTDYSAHCRDRKSIALPRKAWFQAMKLAGFTTDAGGFAGIRLKSE